jgi:hypothetical protein
MSENIIGEIHPATADSNFPVLVERPAAVIRPELSDWLDSVVEALNGDNIASVRTSNSLTFERRMGTTVIRVNPVDVTTIDGYRTLETVTITTDVSSTVHLPIEQVAVANRYASLSALIRDPDSGDLSLATRITNYEGFDNSLAYWTRVLDCAWITHDHGLAAAINDMFPRENQATWGGLPLPARDFEDQWQIEEFESAVEVLNSWGCFANASGQGLTAEFPWQDKGVSAALGHQTNLFTLTTREVHPILGRGLLCKLELWPSFDLNRLVQLIDDLNRFERDQIDGPPFLGAWCAGLRQGGLAFVGFWPNALFSPALPEYLARWMGSRSQIVRGMIENGQV